MLGRSLSLMMLLTFQVNDCHLCGLSRAEVATALSNLQPRVRMVCARRKTSIYSSTSSMQRLVRAKSEQSLASTSESASASLSRNKSRSDELISKFDIWCEPTEVQLVKGDGGLGFSILDDPVSDSDLSHIILLSLDYYYFYYYKDGLFYLFLFIYTFIYTFIHVFIHSFIHSFMYSFIHLFIHSFIHSLRDL